MIETLNTSTPIARKEHRCDYCGGIIHKGERYERQTNKYDGQLYTWKCHTHCACLASDIEPWDEGISDEDFRNWIDEFVYDNHYDNNLDDIAIEWQGKSYEELAKMIYDEISKEDNNEGKTE